MFYSFGYEADMPVTNQHPPASLACSPKLHGLRFRKTLIASLIILAFSVNAAAEANDEAYTEMSLDELMGLEIFHAASLLPTKHFRAPGTVYSFTRADFTRLGARRVEDLLQFVPGIQLNQYRKRHRSIWMRGLLDRYNDKVVLLVDGIRKRHLYYGHFSLGDSLPLERIEKVEIIQGPASSLYGANAFAGIISITTRDFAENQELEATLGLGDNHRGKVGLLYNAPSLQAFGSTLTQDAPFRKDRKSFIGGEVLQPLDEDYSNLSLKVSPVDGLTLMLDYQKNETPFLFIPNTQDAFVDERYLNFAAAYETGDLDSGKLEANLFYTRDNALEYELEQVTQELGYKERQNAVMAGLTVTGFKRLFRDHVFALGFSWQYEEAREMDYERYYKYNWPDDGWGYESGELLTEPGISTHDYAVYLQDVWDISTELNLTLGARFDSFEQFGDHLNYRAALVYSPDERQTWKLMYGTAIRTPAYREYLKVLDTDFVAPIPDPERINSLEIGYNYQWEQASLGITLFNNVVEDYIHEAPTPDEADEYFANSDDEWNMHGVEMLLRYHPTDRLSLRLGAGYLKAKEKGVGDLPYLASWNGSFNLNYNYRNNHHVGLSLFYNDNRQDTNDDPEDQPGSFLLTNLYTHGSIDRSWSYEAGIDNLFDERVYDPAGDFGGQYNTERSEREIWLRIKWNSVR
jgi:outer membrane receptor for ferrienterochelin and colicins